MAFGEPRPASVTELEAALSAFWRSAAEDREKTQAVTRACALNLLIYVESEEAGCEVSKLISQVTLQNPCRAVVMITEPAAIPASLTAWISAHCHLPVAGEKQVCSEEISVRARGEAVGDLANVVVPLTVSGLPVYLWWRGGRFSPAEHFDPILRFTDRVFVDSARFQDLPADLAGLAAQIQRFSGQATFSDLNWTRLSSWRELIAQCFDSSETRPYLEQLGEIRIEYQQGAGAVASHWAQPLLLTGWLASRLNWEPVGKFAESDDHSHTIRFKSTYGAVRVQLVSRPSTGTETAGFISLLLKAEGISSATFSLVSQPAENSVLTRTEIARRPPIERTVRAEVVDEVELLNEELKFASRDETYEEALRMVVRMT